MAEAIAAGASEAGQLDILLYDLTQSAPSEVMKKIDAASGVLFGSPTLVGKHCANFESAGVHESIIHKGILAGAFGSYGWSGEAVPHIEERLKQLKLKMPVPGLKIRFKPSEAQLSDCRKFGRDFAEAVLK
ncbi:MAG: flavodoxin domain-containing protein [Clostridia bacterium]